MQVLRNTLLRRFLVSLLLALLALPASAQIPVKPASELKIRLEPLGSGRRS